MIEKFLSPVQTIQEVLQGKVFNLYWVTWLRELFDFVQNNKTNISTNTGDIATNAERLSLSVCYKVDSINVAGAGGALNGISIDYATKTIIVNETPLTAFNVPDLSGIKSVDVFGDRTTHLSFTVTGVTFASNRYTITNSVVTTIGAFNVGEIAMMVFRWD